MGRLTTQVPAGLPPGTILQLLYLRERLRNRAAGRFVEVGTGAGETCHLLLSLGWDGVGYELHEASVEHTRQRNRSAVADGRLVVRHADWLDAGPERPADLVISSMVIEHLDDEAEAAYLCRAHDALRPGGLAIVLVPASPAHWGVEDDVAGHKRRYTRERLCDRFATAGFDVQKVAGLTFPFSNLVLPISNRLVARAERGLVALSEDQRTRLSGDRNVPGKTTFPAGARAVLNSVTLYPLHLLQKVCTGSKRALVLYAEALKRS